ncbi:MAG: OsmC family protein [Gammaproteobacteria bacterium]|nr:OsmC family protein [Gammaproteobacteria bacterium]
MKITASVQSSNDSHSVAVATGDSQTTLDIKPKDNGRGSSINGGELLFLSLATCYCNDIFREAESMNIAVHTLEVIVNGEFGDRGQPATNVSFDVKISADASANKIYELLNLTDSVAEIQNTLRVGVPVKLRQTKII